ncbi:MAG TPA: hypothetical protein VFZ65_04540 [Planctomycetota bacterium]|nr:hypothetical protein [Planctomycetota bacterium]
MEEQRARVSTDRFWRGLAVAAVVLVAGAVGVQVLDKARVWRAEDQLARHRREEEQARLDAVTREDAARQAAEESRCQRAAFLEGENEKHPERFRGFATSDVVRVLSTAPDTDKRGLACAVMGSDRVEDKESGVVWMMRYFVAVLPLLVDGGVNPPDSGGQSWI